MSISESKYNYLVIEGNIGAGKTSLSAMIAEKYNARLILEQYAENPFLPKFYKDPGRFSFPLELSFLASRYHQLHRELTSPDLFKSFTVADYFFSKSLIFSQVTLQADEFNLYRTLFDIIHQQLPKPELYIYLHVRVEKLIENIQMRGRDYEKNIDREYLIKIQEGYFEYLKSLTGQKVLIFDINDIDFVANRKDFDVVEKAIFDGEYKNGMNRVQL
ncbi:MAG TPA: deoxynucleoside kinase, partial [Bacteroides sp.]|nr:deoxynucleoside kinase [Bacteroides sp.]